MNKKIREMVDALFTGYTATAEELSLRDELMANAQARYDDLTAGGASEDEALAAVAESMEDVRPLLEQMRKTPDAENVKAELDKFFGDLGNWGAGAIRDLDKATDGTLTKLWNAAKSGVESVQQAAVNMSHKPARDEAPAETPVSDFAPASEPEAAAEETIRAEQLRSKAKDLQAQASFKRLTGDNENAEAMEQEAAALLAQADEAERSDMEALEAAVNEAKRTIDQMESEMNAFTESFGQSDTKTETEQPAEKAGDEWSFEGFIRAMEHKDEPKAEAPAAPSEPETEAPAEEETEAETEEPAAEETEAENEESEAEEAGAETEAPEAEEAEAETEEPAAEETEAETEEPAAEEAEPETEAEEVDAEKVINDALNSLSDAVDQVARGAFKAIGDFSSAVEEAVKPIGTEICVSGTACYEVTGVHGICVQTESEDAVVETTAGSSIEVLWEDSRSDCQPEITLEDHVLSVRCKSADPLKSFFSVFKGKSGRVVIRVPQGLAAEYDITTVSGAICFDGPDADEIRAASTSGAVTLKPDPCHCLRSLKGQTVSGDLTVSACADDIKTKTISGRLFITGHAEGIEASTSSGSLYIEGSAAQWEAGTVSGSMELVCTEIPAGRIKLNTISANAKVTLPSDIHGFTADASGVNTAVENEFGSNRYGTGTLPIHLDTVSGKLMIMKL